MKMTFFELKAMFLTELYGLLEMSLETGDFVSEGMALRIERRIAKGANKTWKKLFRKHERASQFYSLKSLGKMPAKLSEGITEVKKPIQVFDDDLVKVETAPPLALLKQTTETV